MRFTTSPKLRDSHVDINTWRNTYEQTQKVLNIQFDPNSFNVQNTSTGLYVTKADQPSFNLDNLLFWYKFEPDPSQAPSTLTRMRINRGEIHFRNQIITTPETYLTISQDKTYVFVQMEWGTFNVTISNTTNIKSATTDATYFRKWLYLVRWSAPNNLWLNTRNDTPLFINGIGIGHMGGAIDLTAAFG